MTNNRLLYIRCAARRIGPIALSALAPFLAVWSIAFFCLFSTACSKKEFGGTYRSEVQNPDGVVVVTVEFKSGIGKMVVQNQEQGEPKTHRVDFTYELAGNSIILNFPQGNRVLTQNTDGTLSGLTPKSEPLKPME
jgi:hypothetical protein